MEIGSFGDVEIGRFGDVEIGGLGDGEVLEDDIVIVCGSEDACNGSSLTIHPPWASATVSFFCPPKNPSLRLKIFN